MWSEYYKFHIRCKLGEGKTILGPDVGEPCHFPFQYKGVKYHGCTDDDSPGMPWCATRAKYSRTQYGYCLCAFGRSDTYYELIPYLL